MTSTFKLVLAALLLLFCYNKPQIVYGAMTALPAPSSPRVETRANTSSAPSTLPSNWPWPPKPPATLRFATSLSDYSTDVTAKEIYDGYKFWESTVNSNGGINIGGGKKLKVEVQVSIDGKNADVHAGMLGAAASEGDADFLLGGDTDLAWKDKDVSQQYQKITMLCCHGPQTVYREASTAAATTNSTTNMLFGIHISSELYSATLVRHIAVNSKAQNIAVAVTLNETNPEGNSLFTFTTCQGAVTELERIRNSNFYERPPGYGIIYMPKEQATNETFFLEVARNITAAGFDALIACTTNDDGRNLIRALDLEKVPLKGAFITVAPTNKKTVQLLTGQGVLMQYALSAGQWHPQMFFQDADQATEMWKDATDFATKFESYMLDNFDEIVPATYTHASAAAAAYSLQLAVTAAFQGCDLSTWSGDADDLLYSKQWKCEDRATATGYTHVLVALRSLNRPTFFGKIQFDENQRNSGRSTVTTQLLGFAGSSNQRFQSIYFGQDAVDNATLVQEVVLPSEYETKEIVLPRPMRDSDPDPCEDGWGLDVNNDCRKCTRGSVRRSKLNGGSSFECLLCGLDSFASDEGMAECEVCPEGTTTAQAGGISIRQCKCKPGFYSPSNVTGIECMRCPDGATCPGGINNISALPGYWLDTVYAGNEIATRTVRLCNPPKACANDGNRTCAEGWGGAVCSLCGQDNGIKGKDAYYLIFGSCEKCLSTTATIVIIVAIFTAWIVLNLEIANSYESIALAIDWMQLMYLVSNINSRWPPSLQRFYSVAQIFAFEVNVVSWRCLIETWDFLADMVLQLSLPLLITLVWVLVALGNNSYRRWWAKAKEREAADEENSNSIPREESEDPTAMGELSGPSETQSHDSASKLKPRNSMLRMISMAGSMASNLAPAVTTIAPTKDISITWIDFKARVLIILEITYVASTQYAMSALRTITVEGKTVLAIAPYMVQSPAVLALGIIGLVLYAIVFPVFLYIKLYSLSPKWPGRRAVLKCKVKEDSGGFREKRNLRMLGWLYAKFRVEHWYMAVAHLLHRFTMTAVISFMVNPGLQLFVSAALTIIVAAFFLITAPYYNRRLNVMQAIMYASVLFQLGFGSCFYSPYELWNWVWWLDFWTTSSLICIGIVGFAFFCCVVLELTEWWCNRRVIVALRKRFPPKQMKQLKDLIEIFNAYCLWSWVEGEIKISDKSEPGQKEPKKDPDPQKIKRDSFDPGEPIYAYQGAEKMSTRGLILFSHVAGLMKEWLSPETNDYMYLSTTGDAMLWRQLVLQYPELVSYLFNEKDGDASHWGAFYERFYESYWRLQNRSLRRRIAERVDKMSPRAREMALSLFRKLGTLEDKVTHLMSKVSKVSPPKDDIDAAKSKSKRDTKRELAARDFKSISDMDRDKEQSETLLPQAAGGFAGVPRRTFLGVAWLLRRRDRAVIAHWLAVHTDANPARRAFVELLCSIGRGPHVSLEERVMNILSFGSVSHFRDIGSLKRSATVVNNSRLLDRGFAPLKRSTSVKSRAAAAWLNVLRTVRARAETPHQEEVEIPRRTRSPFERTNTFDTAYSMEEELEVEVEAEDSDSDIERPSTGGTPGAAL